MRVQDLAAAAVLAAVLAWPAAAHADNTAVLVDDDTKTELTFADNGDATAEVVLSNAGPTFNVVALPADSSSTVCLPDPKPIAVTGGVEKAIEVPFTDCDPESAKNTGFTLVDEADPDVVLFKLTATPPSKPSPDWNLLCWFLVAAIVGLVLLVVSYLAWKFTRPSNVPIPGQPPGTFYGRPKLFEALPNLDASWKFSESWASNATVIAAAFTGIFGATDVTETILGKGDSKEVLAIVAVATASALALAGTAPLLVQTFRRLNGAGAVTPFGLIVAGLVTVAATGGELGVTVAAVRGTDVGDHLWILVAGIIGAVLLAAYAFTATLQALLAGEETHEPPKPPMTLLEVLQSLLDWINHQAAVEEYRNLTPEEIAASDLVEPQAPAPLVMPDVLLPEQRRRTAIL